MKTRYKIFIAFLVVFLTLAIVAYKAGGSLDKIIEVAIENYGSEIIGAEVRVDSVSLNLTAGQATLNGLHISNPEGFSTEYVIQLDQAKVTLDFDSITSDIMIVKEILIQSPAIIYEMSPGGSNVDILANNAKSYSGNGTKSNKSDDAKKIIIENFYVNDGRVSLSHKFLKGKQLSVSMPNIHLRDIGEETQGATPEEVAGQIMGIIKSGVGTGIASRSIGNTFGSGVDAVKKGTGKAIEKAKDAGGKLKGFFN
jgi:hypothetical protein